MSNNSASDRANSATELITSGSVSKAVWFLAWPTATQTLVQTAYMIINTLFVGKLSPSAPALAAIGAASTAQMLQFGVLVALAAGASALVARSLGAGDGEGANEASRQALILCVIGGIVSGAPFIIWAEPIARAVGARGPVIPVCADYLALSAWASIPMFWWFVITTVLRSAGDAKSPLYIGALALSLNVILDWVLILGPGSLPSYGVHGAAVANIFVRLFAATISFCYLWKSVLGDSMTHYRWNSGYMGRILKIGWPAAVGNILWSGAAVAFFKILGYLPNPAQVTDAQAALTVGNRIEAFAFMPGVAYSMAATPLVGQNLGAGKPERAEHSAWVAAWQAVAIMTAVSISFVACPVWLSRLFTQQAAVVALAATYLMINAPSEPFLAVGMVLRGSLQGAGDTLIPMVITLSTLWIVRIPLTWLLAITLGYGANGAWVAMSATSILSGIVIAAWFKWGSWRTRQV